MSEILELNRESFKEKVLGASGKVLVDFNAEWCGPCQMMKPVLEEINGEIKEETGEERVFSINIDDEEELAEEFEVSSIPCLVVFEDGKEVKRSIGVVAKPKVEKMLESAKE